MFKILRTSPRENNWICPIIFFPSNLLKWLTNSGNISRLIGHLITGVSTSSFLYTNTYAIHTCRVLSDNPIKTIGHRAFSIPADGQELM